MKIPFSKRTQWQFDSNPLITRLEEIRKENVRVWDLTESNPTRCGFQYPQEIIVDALHDTRNLSYQPSPKGILEARQAVADYYGRKNIRVDPEQVFLTASTSEAYSFLCRLLVEAGERILVPSPSYPLFELLMEINDVRLSHYWLNDHGHQRWGVDLDSLERATTQETRAVILVHPNNPTGSFIQKEELSEINRFCGKNRLALICDEVFLDYAFTPDDRRCDSLAGNDSVLTFVLGGISKSLCLPQMKLAWMVVNGPPVEVRQAIQRLEMIADAYLSVNTPSQNALGRWLEAHGVIQGEVIERLQRNWAFLEQAVVQTPCRLLPAQGGWYGILKLPPPFSEEEWVNDLLEQDQVFVHPGYFFDFPDEPYVVVSLITPVDVFEEGISRIVRRAQKGHKD